MVTSLELYNHHFLLLSPSAMGELAPPKGSLKRGGSLPLVGLGLGGAQPPLDPTQPVGTSFWNTSDAEFNKKVPLRDMDLFIY